VRWLGLPPRRERASPQKSGAAPLDAVAQYRENAAMAPVETLKLRDNLYLLSGPGGTSSFSFGLTESWWWPPWFQPPGPN